MIVAHRDPILREVIGQDEPYNDRFAFNHDVTSTFKSVIMRRAVSEAFLLTFMQVSTQIVADLCNQLLLFEI